jgi:hypothetical protein
MTNALPTLNPDAAKPRPENHETVASMNEEGCAMVDEDGLRANCGGGRKFREADPGVRGSFTRVINTNGGSGLSRR